MQGLGLRLVSQIEIVEPFDEPPYAFYTENISKNNSGGLAQRKIEAKQVIHYSNTSNPDCASPRDVYTALLSSSRTKDNCLSPIRNPKTAVWYTNTPVGHNTLNKTVK